LESKEKKKVVALSIALVFCLLSIVTFPRAYADTSITFYLNNGETADSGCPSSTNTGGLDTTVPSTFSEVTLSFPDSGSYCTAAKYTGASFQLDPAMNVNLLLFYGSSGAQYIDFNIYKYAGHSLTLLYSLTDISIFYAATPCIHTYFGGLQTAATINPGDEIVYTITRSAGHESDPAQTFTVCTGTYESVTGYDSFIQLYGDYTLPAPEFPLGTLLSIVAPLAAVAVYFIVKPRMTARRIA